jgi:hypothetical protein
MFKKEVTMTVKERTRLKNLDFYYIREIRDGIYAKVYAKHQAECPDTKAYLVENDRVAFWDDSGYDHACVIPIEDILMMEE